MDPVEPEQPGTPPDDGPGSPQGEAPGPPGDGAPGPLQGEAPGPPRDEAPGPLQNETPDPHPDEAAGPSQDAAGSSQDAAGPSEDAASPSDEKALGPLQYGDASSPLHKAPHQRPSPEHQEPSQEHQELSQEHQELSQEHQELSREHQEPSPEHEEPSQRQPIGTIPAAAIPATANADAAAPDAETPAGRKRSRRRKVLAWTSGVLAAVVVVGMLGVYFVYRHLNGNLHQVDISGVLGSQPVNRHPQAENILILGSDTRAGQGGGFGSSAVLNTDHSDTLLIVHIAADRQWADVMSIPRNSWVSIPSFRMG